MPRKRVICQYGGEVGMQALIQSSKKIILDMQRRNKQFMIWDGKQTDGEECEHS